MLDIDCVLRAVAVTQHIYCDARLSDYPACHHAVNHLDSLF